MFKAQNNISRQTGENVLSLEHSIKMEKEKKKKKTTKKQKLKEQWFLEEEAKNHCELIAALM